MSECLDRKQVIELYEKYQPCMATRVYDFGEALRKLPVVEERPHGEWIECEDTQSYQFYECSVCNTPSAWKFGFCPVCGSDNSPRILDEAVDGEGKDGNVKEGGEK